MTDAKLIKVWTKYDFPGRGDIYSNFKWNWTHFHGVDWDENTSKVSIYKFYGKHWDENVDKENFFKETNIRIDDEGYSIDDVETLTPIIDEYVEKHKNVTIEYLHDEEECRKLNNEKDKVGIIFREFKRDTLFDTVINKGSMARKSFSMGEARDKRYYLEAMCIN